MDRGQETVARVYAMTSTFPSEERFGLTNQIRRAAVSVLSNIAEACGRGTSKSTVNFLFIARDSLYEVETQGIIAFDLKYCTESELEALLKQIETCKRLLNGFIRYYESKTTNN